MHTLNYAVVLLLMSVPAFSLTTFDTVPDARSMGMGGSGMAFSLGSNSLFVNPAFLSDSLGADLFLGGRMKSTKTEDPFFGNYSGFNSNMASHFLLSHVSLRKRWALGKIALAFAAGYSHLRDTPGNEDFQVLTGQGYLSEFRSENRFHYDALSVGFAMKRGGLRLGLSWSSLLPSENVSTISTSSNTGGGVFEAWSKSKRTHRGEILRFGLGLEARKNIILGLRLTGPVEIEHYDISSSYWFEGGDVNSTEYKDYTMEYPLSLSAGMKWVLDGETTLAYEYRSHPHSKVQHRYSDTGQAGVYDYDDGQSHKLGVEFKKYGMLFRAGYFSEGTVVQYVPEYTEDDIVIAVSDSIVPLKGMSFGLGKDFQRVLLNSYMRYYLVDRYKGNGTKKVLEIGLEFGVGI